MDFKILVITSFLIFTAAIPNAAFGESEYGNINVYYNDKLYPGASTPTPLIKIGEPFKITIEMKMNQECKAYVELSDIGTDLGEKHFEVIEGPSKLGESTSRIFKENESYNYEWTLKATEEWAGGSAPIDFHYTLIKKGDHDSFLNSGFTAVYPTISTEYYDQPDPTPNQTTNSTPAFTIPVALAALLLAYKRKR